MNQKLIIEGLIVLQLIMVQQTKAADSKPVWNFDDGTYGTGITTTHYYAVPHVYSVTLTVYSLDNHGEICECKETIKHDVVADGCGGDRSKTAKTKSNNPVSKVDTKDVKSNIVLTATPNPFNHSLSVTFQTPKNEKSETRNALYNLTMLNAAGSTISTKSINPNTTVEFNTATYPAGMYFLNLKSTDGITQSTKVVKVNQ